MQHRQTCGLGPRVVFLAAVALALSACTGNDRNTADTAMGDTEQYPGPMPPFGQMLSPEQVRATAAYVYSLTHPVGSG